MTKNIYYDEVYVYLLRKIITSSNGINTRFEIFSDMFQKLLMSKQWYRCAQNHSLLFYTLNLQGSLKMSTFPWPSVGALCESQKWGLSKAKKSIFLAEGFVCLFVMFHPSEMSAGDAKQNVDKIAKRSHLSCNKAWHPFLVIMRVMFIRAP